MFLNKDKDIIELSTSLQGLFDLKNWSTLWQTWLLAKGWPEIAGKNVAKNSEPAYIQKHTLWVYVQSSVLMQHMQSQKLQLLKRINTMFPEAEIKDIRWEMQPAAPLVETKQNIGVDNQPLAPGAEKAFEAMASTVEDDECRKALKKLWQKYHTT